MTMRDPNGPAENAELLELKERLAAMTRAVTKKTLPALAKAKGLREDALADLLKRAEIFELTATGELRAPGGMTPEGWIGFVLPKEAPFLFEASPPSPVGGGKAETARERLARANGEPEVSGFE